MLWRSKKPKDPVIVGPMDPHGIAILKHLETGREQHYECRDVKTHFARISLSSGMYINPSRPQLKINDWAVERSQGAVLDIGAGGGAFSMRVSESSSDVTSIDTSSHCVEAMKQRGIENVQVGSVEEFDVSRYDTLVFLDSTLGCVGGLDKIDFLLESLANRCKSSARLVIHDGSMDPGTLSHEWQGYFRYEQYVGESFRWCSISATRLSELAETHGWKMEEPVEEFSDGRYGAVLVR